MPEVNAVTFDIRCQTDRNAETWQTHAVTINPDGSVSTPHDLDVERAAEALGGYLSCLHLSRAVEAVRKTPGQSLRALPLIELTGSWAHANGCHCPKFPSAAEAVEGLRTPEHLAHDWDLPPWQTRAVWEAVAAVDSRPAATDEWQRLESEISAVVSSLEHGEYVVFHLSGGDPDGVAPYVQVLREGWEFLAEVVGNRYLAPDQQLLETQVRILTDTGWNEPTDHRPNFYRSISLANGVTVAADAFADWAVRAFRQVFGAASADRITHGGVSDVDWQRGRKNLQERVGTKTSTNLVAWVYGSTGTLCIKGEKITVQPDEDVEHRQFLGRVNQTRVPEFSDHVGIVQRKPLRTLPGQFVDERWDELDRIVADFCGEEGYIARSCVPPNTKIAG